MNACDPLQEKMFDYYEQMPWVALIRILEVEQLKAELSLCQPPVLDLGCGDGFIAKAAFECQLDAGIDLDTETLRRAEASGAYRRVVQANATALPFEDGEFRTVYSNGAMEHMNQLPKVLSEIARVLKPGGVLVTLVPSDKFKPPVGALGRLLGQGLWNAYNRLHNHVNLLSPDEWRKELKSEDLHQITISTYGGTMIADRLCNFDLWSKLHVSRHWPFFRLCHGGNLGLLTIRPSIEKLKRLVTEEDRQPTRDGFWLKIVATRR